MEDEYSDIRVSKGLVDESGQGVQTEGASAS